MTSASLFFLKAQSVRTFREEARFDIRPLTLLYGFNQAGKSTMLRLLALLADSLQNGAGPLDLQCPALRGATFKELGWLGREPSLSPWLTLIAPSSQPQPTLKLQFADDSGLVVNRLHLVPGDTGDKFIVDLDGAAIRDGNRYEANYAGKYRGADWHGTLKFASLLPEGLPEQAEGLAHSVKSALGPLQRVQWLHANRLAEGPGETRPVRCCRASGSDLPSVLSTSTEGPAVLESASEWLRQQEGMGNGIELRRDSSGRPELVHGATGRESLPLHLAGEGVRALLPILLCVCWAETQAPAAPTLLAVEEPEAHLHPSLQVALFDRLAETVQAGIPVVLETHSVYLLRAMQLAVLDGRLNPEQVGLHWVEQGSDGAAKSTKIGIEPDATLTGWRPDLFEKEQELAHRILDLRWNKGSTC
jgi:hypothetical protein